MTTTTVYGAETSVWLSYEKAGWGDLMLPVVSDPNAQIDPSSKMAGLGKTPSVLTPSGTAVGLKGWPKLEVTEGMRRAWSGQGLGICLRCGPVVAFDCDVDSPEVAQEILDLFIITFGVVPIRRRAGSHRWLAVLRMQDADMPKRVLTLPTSVDGKTDALEVLCAGQQFVAEGTHPSGSRYTWSPSAPVLSALPETSQDEVDEFILSIAKRFGAALRTVKSGARAAGETKPMDDPLADWLRKTGRVIDEDQGVLHLKCPWEAEHTSKSGISATSYFSCGVNGDSTPGFKCLHAHCADRTYSDLLSWAVENGYTAAKTDEFPELPALDKEDEETHALMRVIQRNADPKTGLIAASLPTVMAALQLKEYCRVLIAHDTFTGSVVYKDIADGGKPLRGDRGSYSAWSPFGDAETILMRERLEREFSFKAISKELMRDAVNALALGGVQVVDCMQDFLNARLPRWDGVERCRRFFTDYCGAEDSKFSAELGRYVFAALYGRAWCAEGVKADITPILVGKQGTFKSSLISLLAIKPGTFREIDFSEKDDNIKRALRGCSVIELPEMSGFSRRDADNVKFFLSLKEDSWVPKYLENAITVPRRCVFFASTNNHEILNDPTGSRRFAPIETGVIKLDEVSAILPQLWAEGRHIFETEGIPHRELEMLAATRSSKFEAVDPWAEALVEWLMGQDEMQESDRTLLTTKNALVYGIGVAVSKIQNRDSKRVGAIFRQLGYSQGYIKNSDGKTVRIWKK